MNLQEIKDKVAVENGYRNWDHYFNTISNKDLVDKVAEQYAEEFCNELISVMNKMNCVPIKITKNN